MEDNEQVLLTKPVAHSQATTSAPRQATEDIELAGKLIKRGDLVRQIQRNLAFGQGIHICLGAPLARLEGEIAFTTLLRHLPNLRLNAPRDSGNLRGLTALPVAF